MTDSMSDRLEPTIALLKEAGIENPTLDDWLDANGAAIEDCDAELVPAIFFDDYVERVRLVGEAIPRRDVRFQHTSVRADAYTVKEPLNPDEPTDEGESDRADA